MRKLYVLLGGLLISLAATHLNAQTTIPDIANFTTTVDHAGKNVAFTNTSVIGNLPGDRRALWSFGDGHHQWTPALANTTHHYEHPGSYNVCLKLFRIINHDTLLTAQVCKTVVIETVCRADFERIAVHVTANPLVVSFKALPFHNDGKKPVTICWWFGDGTDTCITYTNSYTGPYVVSHRYNAPGNYNVCVRIVYQGGCVAEKCRIIHVEAPQCKADFERLAPTTTNNPLQVHFRALPWHINNKKPSRICWRFGDGTDTCIDYPENYTGQYTVGHRYNHPGYYEVCVVIKYYGGCEARKCKEINLVLPHNACGGYMTEHMIAPKTFNFKAFAIHPPNDEAISYTWRFGDGTTAVGRDVTHTYQYPGVYEVCVFIRTRKNCETKICKPLIVPPANSTAILELSPNPVVNIIHVQFFSMQTETVSIKIINSSGVVVRNYSRSVNAGSNTWNHDLTTLVPGPYNFVVQSPNQFASRMFMKL
jgi:PKD repeat protein